MFGGNKKNGKRKRSSGRSRQERSYDEFGYENEEGNFGRNQPPPQAYDQNGYGHNQPQQDPYQQRPQRQPQGRPPQRDQSFQPNMVDMEPTMLPESRHDRQQRSKPRNDGSSRDRAIRELPPNMPDFGDAAPPPPQARQQPPPQRQPQARQQPPPQDRSNGRPEPRRQRPPSPPEYDQVIGAPTPKPQPQYDDVIGNAPPPQQPAQRPARPQIEMRRPDERNRRELKNNQYANGNGNAPSPNGRIGGNHPQQRPQQPANFRQNGAPQPAPQPQNGAVRFDQTDYGDNGYANYEVPSKGRKKGKRRKKKEKVQMPDQKMDVGESIDLRDGTSRLLMRFDAGVVDNLRHMTTRLSSTTGEIPSRIALVSALPGEGVTYVSRALATVMAHDMSARVAYVDLNWWSDGQPEFAHPDNQGLVSVVTGEKRLDEIFVSTTIPNLTLVPGGKLERGDRPIMARSNVLSSAIDVLDQHFDYLIFDLPAIRATNDSVPLAKLAKGVVMVVKQGETPNETVRQAIDEIQHLNLLGMMLNQVHYKTPEFIRRVIPQD